MKAFLENFAAIIGAVTVAILSMSWAHEYGYFASLGRQFQTFLTTSDYLANGVLWLPVGILFIYQAITWKLLSVEEPTKTNRKSWATWLENAVAAVYFLWVLSVITLPLTYFPAFGVVGVVVIIWGRAWRSFYKDVHLEEPFQLVARELIRLGPPVIIGMFLYGSVNAQSDLTRTDNVYLFRFKNADNPQLLVFLRNFDRGVLVRNAVERRIDFLKWDDITGISAVAPQQSNSLGCWMLGWLCDDEHKSPKVAPNP